MALCGPKPDLAEIEKTSIQCWRSHIDILRSAEKCYPNCFPSTISLDPSILGYDYLFIYSYVLKFYSKQKIIFCRRFLLIDYQTGKYVAGRNPKPSSNHPTGTHKLDILRSFYYQAVEVFLTSEPSDKQEHDKNTNKKPVIRSKETYWCLEYYKCHALKEKDNIICILYTYTIPIHTIRLITRKTLKILISDKQVCW